MSIEAIKLRAYTLFLSSDNWDEIAEAIETPVSTVKGWAKKEGWFDRKDNFYSRTQDKIDAQLEDASTRIAQDVIGFSSDMIDGMREKFLMEIQDIEVGNFKDMMLGIKNGVDAIKDLLNLGPDKKDDNEPMQLIASKMSIEKQKILLGTLDKIKTQLPEFEEEDEIELEMEEYHEGELAFQENDERNEKKGE